ncbi:hypothetical protein M441DRAFT_93267 [Trichoderma asperellum CBS 433.97]|uniref:Zn(2)-C6 fungal-type domain-containing protein n=1 Tax=Trichoderma asperellum (strain ATCC 204424 / CBS 433.97 / NBRC 101777) TaxID=1042311 RepID=A0A2T3YUF3_TRIA4|nr:hypothetical protein M441DRAFT_93267 [Trichoderma asperellum CBS 433.97]PTB36144.1 hypothetical protein M441DRAFT_93267 [Trichoderma asperellum CBS 433.97]
MASLATVDEGVARVRSRAGCHTCRLRKVRCKAHAGTLEDAKEQASICSNCKRLGLKCRWQPPAPGERVSPPPKRRQMIGRRPSRRVNEENSRSSPMPTQPLKDDSTHTLDENDDIPVFKELIDRNQTPHSDQSNDVSSQPQSDQFELFSGAPYYFDADLDYQSLELDLSGEGLNLIPLPAVSPSVLQGPNNAQALSFNDGFSLEDAGNSVWQFEAPLTDGDQSILQTVKAKGPSVNEGNRQLIQHYLEVMKGYAKVDDRSKDTNNLFISAFSKSLSFPPLFYAILSFSASHLSMETPSYSEQAKVYDRLAHESFNQFAHDNTSTVDGLLSALFVRVKQVHVTAGNIDTFFELIAAAIDIVRSEEVEKALADPSSLIRRIVIRLAILDARASHYGLGGGKLVQHLRNVPAISSIFEEVGQTSIIGDVNTLFRADVFRMHVARLDLRIQDQLRSESATFPPVRIEEIKSLYKSIQQQADLWEVDAVKDRLEDGEDIVEDEQLSSATYGRFTVLSALHSALLYLYTVYPLMSFDPEVSVSKILHYHLKIRHDPSRSCSPSSILPSSLFLAGICTGDAIRRDWIIERFREGEAWGVYIQKARELLQAIVKLRKNGHHPSIRSVMDEVTGRFII